MSHERTLQPWAEQAFEFFRRCFPLIDLKTSYIDDNLWDTTYVLLFGINELCDHFDCRIELKILVDETRYQPHIRCLDPDLGRCLVDLTTSFLDDPDALADAILECRLHPIPGTKPPDHEARIETLRMIQQGEKVSLDGVRGSPEMIDRLLMQLRSGAITLEEWQQFDPELLDALRMRMEDQMSELAERMSLLGGEPVCRSPQDRDRWASYWNHRPAGDGKIN